MKGVGVVCVWGGGRYYHMYKLGLLLTVHGKFKYGGLFKFTEGKLKSLKNLT